MSEEAAASEAKPNSLGRLLAILIPIGLVGYLAVQQYGSQIQNEAEEKLVNNTLRQLFDAKTAALELADTYKDADGDLIADAPEDAESLLDPEELKFTYIASATTPSEEAGAMWKELVEAVSEKIGRPVSYVHYTDVEEQLRALRNGELHICAFGTGATPVAVNASGFVPVCTFGREDGNYGYTMKIIVPAESEIKELKDIADQRMAFVRPRSNSGYKAPLILLSEEDLLPERDYRWGFTYGHDRSILLVASGEFDAGAVASDLLEGMTSRGEIEEGSLREVYESERFPPAAMGHAYNLKQDLAEGVRQAMLEFDWSGTALEEVWGASGNVKFVPIDYKQDWNDVREVDKAVAEARALMDG